MKQREFVVVVLRLFAVWFGLQAIINFIDSVSSPSIRQQPVMTLVFIAFALILVLGISMLVWIKSETLMERAYAGSEGWSTEPAVFEPIDMKQEMPVDALSHEELGDQTSTLQAEQYNYEPVANFATGITARDIFMTFLIGLGIWLLVSSLPGLLTFIVKYLQLPSEALGDPANTKILTLQLVYYATQVIIGIALLKPSWIVDRLWSERVDIDPAEVS